MHIFWLIMLSFLTLGPVGLLYSHRQYDTAYKYAKLFAAFWGALFERSSKGPL